MLIFQVLDWQIKTYRVYSAFAGGDFSLPVAIGKILNFEF